VREGLLGQEALEGAYRDDTSNYVIMLLRMITSAEVQRREDFFLPFILVRCSGRDYHVASIGCSTSSAACSCVTWAACHCATWVGL
jgi:hypothetical protein